MAACGGEIKMQKKFKSKDSVNKRSLMQKRNQTGYVFITPFLIGFALFMLIPLIQSFIFSFNDIKIVENGYTLIPKGLYNYKNILMIDTRFRQNIVSSFGLTIRDTLVVVPFSFFAALILSKEFKGRTIARAIFFLPVIVSTGVLSTIDMKDSVMMMMMSRDAASAANSMKDSFSASSLVNLLFSGSLPISMLETISQATSGIYEYIIKSGIQIIIFIGGLNTISPSLYESSNIEGATGWVNFWKITFPMCGPYILLNLVYTIIDSFTNLSNPLISRIRNDLMGLKNFGTASAAAWIYFIAIFIVLGIVFAVLQRRVFYHE
jgi:ABC-type sugar transport system permease subunit